MPIYQAISKNRSSNTAEDFNEGLRHFDKDGNGYISSAELRHLLTSLGIFFFYFTTQYKEIQNLYIWLFIS